MYSNVWAQNSAGNYVDLSQAKPPARQDADERVFFIPPEMGAGAHREIRFGSGLTLTIIDYRFERLCESRVEVPRPAFGFGFCLSGHTRCRLTCFRDEFMISGGQSALYYFPEMISSGEVIPEAPVRRVSIRIDPPVFRRLVDEHLLLMPTAIRKAAQGESSDPSRFTSALTPEIRRILEQIMTCGYPDAIRHLFLESKTMELVSRMLGRFLPAKGAVQRPSGLKPDDIDRAHAAREILEKSIQTPPGLVALSRQVGLSRTKLLNSFQAVFGQTPASYLRDRRIEIARALLHDGRMSITEIAHHMGYASSSHFTKVFKKYYGTVPSRIQTAWPPPREKAFFR